MEELQTKLSIEWFGVERFSNDDSLLNFYTGIEKVKLFLYLYEKWRPSVETTYCFQTAYEIVQELADQFQEAS